MRFHDDVMKRATETYTRDFDAVFLRLDAGFRSRVQAKISELGRNLETYPHQRLKGRTEFKLRVGDYRVIYDFDIVRNELHLIAMGHRREVYRD
jgi:mRNA interferase RelE/StbE